MYAATSLGRKLGLRDSIFSGLRHGEYPGSKVTLGPDISALSGGGGGFLYGLPLDLLVRIARYLYFPMTLFTV